MEDGELVFIAMPAMGHVVAQVELAKNLVAHHPLLFIAILIPNLPSTDANLDTYLRSASPPSGDARISLIKLPPLDNPPDPEVWRSKPYFFMFNLFGNLYKPVVKRVVENRSRRVLGIVSDMLIPQFADVADELQIPSFLLITSGANLLALTFKLESLGVDIPLTFGDSPPETTTLEVPGFRNPIPVNAWPGNMLNKEVSAQIMSHVSRHRNFRGILVNTFAELEPEILLSLAGDNQVPPVYAVGPLLDLSRQMLSDGDLSVVDWLDAQPPASVVFFCFGSAGSFRKEQVEQIAVGIERSGHRFLWSLRRPPNSDKGERLPSDYNDFREIIPPGFLDRTIGIGKMIGWAPQTMVLGHPAVGAFVSHCGWNSVLESMWFGVPMVTWPMYAEQQLNAFYMVRELGIAVELKNDYMYNVVEKKGNVLVMATEVERGIRNVMGEDESAEVRTKVKKMSEFAKKALDIDGSSHKSLRLLVDELN